MSLGYFFLGGGDPIIRHRHAKVKKKPIAQLYETLSATYADFTPVKQASIAYSFYIPQS